MCAKSYRNGTVYVSIIASQRWDVFWGTVYIRDVALPPAAYISTERPRISEGRRNWMHPAASACTGGGSGADCPVQSLYPIRRCWWRRKRPAHAAGHYLPLASDNDGGALPPGVACSTLCSLGPARPIGARSGTRWFFPLVCGGQLSLLPSPGHKVNRWCRPILRWTHEGVGDGCVGDAARKAGMNWKHGWKKSWFKNK